MVGDLSWLCWNLSVGHSGVNQMPFVCFWTAPDNFRYFYKWSSDWEFQKVVHLIQFQTFLLLIKQFQNTLLVIYSFKTWNAARFQDFGWTGTDGFKINCSILAGRQLQIFKTNIHLWRQRKVFISRVHRIHTVCFQNNDMTFLFFPWAQLEGNQVTLLAAVAIWPRGGTALNSDVLDCHPCLETEISRVSMAPGGKLVEPKQEVNVKPS